MLVLIMSISVFFLICLLKFSHSHQKPNFVVFLTDDQDVMLGGLVPLSKTKELIADNGAEFLNMFVSSPLCCPSRASILTGLYSHNHGVVNNSLNGNCNSQSWQQTFEKQTVVTYLRNAGYVSFYGGKYLNQYGAECSGGVKHIPPGWDEWAALVGNSVYYNYTLSVNGQKEVHGDVADKDYLTNVIANKAVEFLSRQNGSKPFFLMLSPPAPHAPFTPVPWYKSKYQNISAPETPNFNIPGGHTKHWLLRQPPSPLPKNVLLSIDEVTRNRWRTLLSVDDAIQRIFEALTKQNFLKNTFIFFTSDNGFHLGQFSLPWDKRQPYETDIRVPLSVRGPGIKPGLVINKPVLNVDIMPTILDLADIKNVKRMDGISFLPLLTSPEKNIAWRTEFIVEHQGEASTQPIPGCPQYKEGEVHTCDIDCICEDSVNNTYICLRTFSTDDNSIHCLFQDNESFVEIYNITADPFQLKNLYFRQNKESQKRKVDMLKMFKQINQILINTFEKYNCAT